MQVSSLFLNNMNIMLILTVILLLISLVLIGLGAYHKNSTCKSFGKRLLKEGIITFVLFSTFNLSFSAGIHWKYNKNEEYLNSIVLYAVLSALLASVVALEMSSKK